jgi:hypothetical protein
LTWLRTTSKLWYWLSFLPEPKPANGGIAKTFASGWPRGNTGFRNSHHGRGNFLGSHEKATLQLPAPTLQLSSTAIWLLSLYPGALTVTAPTFRALTPAALMEETAIVVLPPAARVPDPGDTPNQGMEGTIVKFIAWVPAVNEHVIGIPKVAGSVPSTRVSGTSSDPEQGTLPLGQAIAEVAGAGVETTGGRKLPHAWMRKLNPRTHKKARLARDVIYESIVVRNPEGGVHAQGQFCWEKLPYFAHKMRMRNHLKTTCTAWPTSFSNWSQPYPANMLEALAANP